MSEYYEAANKYSGENVVLTAGCVLRGDDAAGPMLAKLLEDNPVWGWVVVDGQQTPEDELSYIRGLHPKRILFVDAAEMGLAPGEVRRLGPADVSTSYLLTTHSIPMTYLLGELYRCCKDVTFLGVQPGTTNFFEPLTPPVLAAIRRIVGVLREGADFTKYDCMQPPQPL